MRRVTPMQSLLLAIDATEGETSIGKLVRGLADKPRRHTGAHAGEITKWIVVMTSDATKASATDEIDPTLPPDITVTSTLRGSYAVTHHADVTMAIDVEHGPADQDERAAKLYVGVTRGAPGSERPLPLRYFRSLGRFVAVDPTPQTTASPANQQSGAPEGFVVKPPSRRGENFKTNHPRKRKNEETT